MRRYFSGINARRKYRSAGRSQVLIEEMEPRQYLSVTFGAGVTLGDGEVDDIAVADFANDNKPDLVAVAGQSVDVYPNEGNGKFGAAITLPYSGRNATDVAIGDYDGNGLLDIAVDDAADDEVYCYLLAGVVTNGTNPSFLAPVVSSYGTAEDAPISEMQTAHFGGTMDDLVVQNYLPDDETEVLLATGGGSFAMPDQANILTAPGGQPVSGASPFAIADFNGDGISDIAYSIGGTLEVQFGAIGGSFLTSQYPYTVPGGAEGPVVAGVLTAGGLPDLVTTSGQISGGATVDVLFNNGGGSFGTAQTYPVDGGETLALGDFADNGSLDIFSGTQVLVNTGGGEFEPAADTGISGPTAFEANAFGVDLNGDGHADLVFPGPSYFIEGASNNGGGGGGGGGGTTNTSPLSPVLQKNTLPTSVVAGQKSHGEATVDVTNTGSSTEKGNATVAIYASSDGSVDGSSILLASVSRKVTLKSHGKLIVPVSIKSLPATLSGNYTLLIEVTDPSGDTAVTSSGPALTAAAPFLNFSDTLISDTLAPFDTSGKTKASVRLRIANGGNIASKGKSTIALYLSPDTSASDGTLIRTVSESIALKPGASRVVNLALSTLPSVAAGNYYLVVQVTDPKGDVTETASSGTYALNLTEHIV